MSEKFDRKKLEEILGENEWIHYILVSHTKKKSGIR